MRKKGQSLKSDITDNQIITVFLLNGKNDKIQNINNLAKDKKPIHLGGFF